jgi:anthranilate/para-aminobenzoate synthase component II
MYDPKGAMTEKPSSTLPGTVEKIIKSPFPGEPEKAQIAVEGVDHLYKELRVENSLTDENGIEVQWKQGAKVKVTVEAKPEDTSATSDDRRSEFSATSHSVSASRYQQSNLRRHTHEIQKARTTF